MGSINNPYENIVPDEQPHEQPREEVIITPKPEKHPYDPAIVDGLIKEINDDEQAEEDWIRRIENEKDKPTIQ